MDKQLVDQLVESTELTRIIQSALEQAKTLGATSSEVGVSVEAGLSVMARLGQVETVVFNRDKNFGITVYKGQSKGAASTSDSSASAISACVKAACDIAKHTEPDPYAGLADPNDFAKKIEDLDLYHPWPIPAEAAIKLAIECESLARSLDKRITNSDGANIEAYEGIHAYGNSAGFLHSYKSTKHGISCSLIAGTGDDMVSDYWYSVARDGSELDLIEEVAHKVVERCVSHIGARRLSTRQSPILFVPEMARGLLGSFTGAISGGSLYRKASFLLDHLNKPIFPDFVQIVEQPFLPKGLGSSYYDSEGVATNAAPIITDGVLQRYLLGSYSARRLGLKTTGNAGGVHNLTITPGDKDFNALVKIMDTGLIVTELMGHGVNQVTGDYSRGAKGFWVEGGAVQYPVHEITIAGNLKDMFSQLIAVGNDLDKRGNIITGSFLIDNMTIAGT